MKKLVLALSIFTLALSLSSCDLLGGLKEKFISDSTPKEQPQEVAETPAPAPTPAPNEVRIYANAYDGFVNIRAQPSAKSAKLGRLNNGNDYLVKLGVQGKWTIVKWQNGIGYVNSTIVGYSPWKPVYLNVDGDSLQGAYGLDEGGDYFGYYLVFNNGKFAHIQDGKRAGDQYYGTWKLEGTDIIFTTKYVASDHFGRIHVGETKRLPVKSNMIGDYVRERFSAGDTYFQQTKKKVNKLVSLK